MEKDFDHWNIQKKEINTNGVARFYRECEIWWCAIGINIGDEQDGTGKIFDRPIIVIKAFNKQIFFGAALTGKKREGKYYFSIGIIEGREASVILSQVRIVDTKRLIRRLAVLDEVSFKKLKSALRVALLE